ncbi:apolipoprotein N-acyltransferase [Nonlabens xiamenensis]|uniref:apolipoprotein N-acyltransferase n=1 Tax=Nonlabens xiamenensis TaxID=2341043 RepID=UPI0029392371|nr:apolipoprotein N-acyltransferase [Nonlabens xiamenensis]
MKATSLLLASCSGILFWLGWPTYGFAGLLFIAWIPLLLAERRIRLSTTKRKTIRVLGHAYLTFFIWNIATTYWLYFSTAFGMWFAVLVNSLLMSLVFLGYHLMAKKVGQAAGLSFLVCLWISFERLHLHWDFSWPWLNLGNGFSEQVGWIQWYEYTGTFGGTIWVWIVNIALFLSLFPIPKHDEKFVRPTFKFILKRTLLPIGLLVVPVLISQALVWDPISFQKGNGTEVVIIQPNIDPYEEKYEMDNDSIVKLIMTLAENKLQPSTQFLITPETVLADNIQVRNLKEIPYDPNIQKLRSKLAAYPQLNYLGGISMAEIFRDESRYGPQSNTANDGRTFYNDYNSAIFLKADRDPQLYHKSKLVVGVENFPYKNILEPILGNAMLDLGGTVATKTTQEDRSVFESAEGIKVAPIICYESVYGEFVTDYVNNGAQFLAIITNDAWWGNTQGHQQHLSLARLRAIENRRWIARSANTGISAIINDKGDVVQSLGYEQQGSLAGKIRPRCELTFYSKHGDYIARIAGMMAVFILLFSVLRRGKLKRK